MILAAEDSEHEVARGGVGVEAVLLGDAGEEFEGLVGLFIELLEDIEDGFLGGRLEVRSVAIGGVWGGIDGKG